jgi:hypothetical protein
MNECLHREGHESGRIGRTQLVRCAHFLGWYVADVTEDGHPCREIGFLFGDRNRMCWSFGGTWEEANEWLRTKAR